MICLIDGDIVAFRAAASCEKKLPSGEIQYEPEYVAHFRTDETLRKILDATRADSYRIFVSGCRNFRKDLSPGYKANRKDKILPKWRESCNEFLITEWKGTVTDGIEADDALGIMQTNLDGNSVICSIDKDLKQISGMHYNWVKDEWDEVSELQGIHNFYKQLLIGDTVDNIFGIDGIGPKKAAKIIEPLFDETEMLYRVRKLYKNDDRLIMNGKLLWILKEERGVWNPMNIVKDVVSSTSTNSISSNLSET